MSVLEVALRHVEQGLKQLEECQQPEGRALRIQAAARLLGVSELDVVRMMRAGRIGTSEEDKPLVSEMVRLTSVTAPPPSVPEPPRRRR
jgi:hypothetical protein